MITYVVVPIFAVVAALLSLMTSIGFALWLDKEVPWYQPWAVALGALVFAGGAAFFVGAFPCR